MHDRLKYFGQIISLLTLMIIAAHEIIPHHHHRDSMFSFTHEAECHGDKSDDHHDRPPQDHCHALNDILFDQASQNKSPDISAQVSFAIVCSLINQTISEKETYGTRLTGIDLKPVILYIMTNSPLRAPPASV